MNDEWTPTIADDPVPPEPDAALLARVVGRGRQRLVRRRAIYAAVAASLAVVLVGSGVAVAQRRDASPAVSVSPTTTIPVNPVTMREGDAEGMHFTLTLVTPTVVPSGTVRVTMRLDNHRDVGAGFGPCEFGAVTVYQPRTPLAALTTSDGECSPLGTVVDAGHSFTWTATTAAPAQPGEYWVLDSPSSAFPASLRAPLSLRVLDVSAGSYTQPVDPRTPQLGDFSGMLTADPLSAPAGTDVHLALIIRNGTHRDIEPSLAELSQSVAIVCDDRHGVVFEPPSVLRLNENVFLAKGPALEPGETSRHSAAFRVPEIDGGITCAAVIVAAVGGSTDGTIRVVGRLDNVGTASFTATSATPEPTTTVAGGETTTTSVIGP